VPCHLPCSGDPAAEWITVPPKAAQATPLISELIYSKTVLILWFARDEEEQAMG